MNQPYCPAASNGRKDTVAALLRLQPQSSQDSSSSSSSGGGGSSSSMGLTHLLHTLSFYDPEHAALDIAAMLCANSRVLQVLSPPASSDNPFT